MTGAGRKALRRECDLELVIPVGTEFWEVEQHEPLLMFLCFPLCRYHPWILKGTGYLESFCGEMRGVWNDVPEWPGDLLRQLLVRTGLLQSVSEGLVRQMLLDFIWDGVSNSDTQR